jgi:hypothetical protein
MVAAQAGLVGLIGYGLGVLMATAVHQHRRRDQRRLQGLLHPLADPAADPGGGRLIISR